MLSHRTFESGWLKVEQGLGPTPGTLGFKFTVDGSSTDLWWGEEDILHFMQFFDEILATLHNRNGGHVSSDEVTLRTAREVADSLMIDENYTRDLEYDGITPFLVNEIVDGRNFDMVELFSLRQEIILVNNNDIEARAGEACRSTFSIWKRRLDELAALAGCEPVWTYAQVLRLESKWFGSGLYDKYKNDEQFWKDRAVKLLTKGKT